MKKSKLFYIILFFCVNLVQAELLVTNVNAEQIYSAQYKPIRITYDLYGAPTDGVIIVVKILTNQTEGFVLDPTTLSGDVGVGITNGLNKSIEWTSVADWASGTYYNVKFKVFAFNGRATADPDVTFKPVGIVIHNNKAINTLEWDLQSRASGTNIQFSPFYCAETSVTAAQYCRFLNAYKNRFTDKLNPACITTSVFANAQGGIWIEVTNSQQLCTIRSTPSTGYNNAYSKIKWDAATNLYLLNVSDWHTNQPMTEVTWFGAVAYCMWLNETEFGSNVTNWKYRLPTEWEREFLMGAKQYSVYFTTQDWGNASWTYGMCSDEITHTHNTNNWANYKSDSIYGLHGVGTKPEVDQLYGYGYKATNVFGCYELSGNVWEWTIDYSAFSPSPKGKNYVYRKYKTNRTIRGGSWRKSSSYLKTNYRVGNAPTNLYYDVGFRVVRSLE